jgi:hypothetical protein
MSARRYEPGWVPYFVPMFAFLIIVEIGARVPEAAKPWLLLLQVAVPGWLFLRYARRNAYPELRSFAARPAALALDVAVGLAVTALWVGPFLLGWLSPPEEDVAFDPNLAGEALRPFVLGVRLAGFALVTPFVEELFVRSFLLRGAELVRVSRRGIELDETRDFRDLPIGRFTWWSFGVTVLYFTGSHLGFELPVALATGILYNLWLYHRRHLGATILAHAVTNASLFTLVTLASGRIPDGRGGFFDLWYFL